MTDRIDTPWDGNYKIPWNEPGFSKRMLAEHLTQQHDMASRRIEWIDRQVAWIHETVLVGRPSRILDLGCGPGLYSHRLAALGHDCHGIDFSPASIEYALEHTPDAKRCSFALGDICQADFAGPYELAMFLFGELNVFPPEQAKTILRKAHASLVAGGRLLVELQSEEAVRQTGMAEDNTAECESGLFCERPHTCRIENRWLDDQQVAVQLFHITETASADTQIYRSTTKAWAENDFRALLAGVGFAKPAVELDWPNGNNGLVLWAAEKR